MNLSKQDYERMMKLTSTISIHYKKASIGLQEQLSQLLGYHSSILWKVDQKGNLSDPKIHRISDYLLEDYLDCFHTYDYLHPKKQLHLFREKVVLRLEDVTPIERYEHSDYYKEFMRKHNYFHEMVVTFRSHNKFVGALGITRSRLEGEFTEDDCHKVRMLAPMISNLLYLEGELEEQRIDKGILEAFAAKSETGLILLDEKYQTLYINPAAWNIYKNTVAYKDIDRFIKEIIFALSNQSIGSNPFLIETQGYNVQVISHQEPFLSKQSRYAIIIEKEKTIDTSEEEREFFQLTKREKEICYYLKRGYTYKKIAETLFISINTVNKHIKNIYQKTGVNNRALLQARLLEQQ
ncbi:LuxR C-terminal-related transcriptional regulator [Bacillus sp. EB600]|uniref:LuxR C-terminal-related transcriptional regulator n=1 Tax=Bacillus sp. EB600 TaxID=2806345 RepID=UPI00210CA52C|nr:LuxR C-terminal-related transcriptional regulator [Bacillus sp. EB600]MCQ6282906.1 GAF domain-containing protein [Bacillus sp. EB600]